MEDKYLKDIAQSLKGIHQELKKQNEPNLVAKSDKKKADKFDPKNFI
ncbi:hypothetical protein [Staphylococcus saprophyticus]|nr:hypothetical protein [Staphylococcus saprophyticus]